MPAVPRELHERASGNLDLFVLDVQQGPTAQTIEEFLGTEWVRSPDAVACRLERDVVDLHAFG